MAQIMEESSQKSDCPPHDCPTSGSNMIKHVYRFSESSSLLLVLDRRSLEHSTIQLVRSDDRDKVLERVTSAAIAESGCIVQFLREASGEQNTHISWLVYENCLCSLDDYLALIKAPGIVCEELFLADNEFLDHLYLGDSDEYSFDLKDVAGQYICQLFEMTSYLESVDLHELFSPRDVFIAQSGLLKLFPARDWSSTSRRNRDPEAIVRQLRSSGTPLGSLTSILQESDCQGPTNGNLFEAALLAVRVLFRDWSPFRPEDLSKELRDHFGIGPLPSLPTEQEIWLVRTVYDPNINVDFIHKGLSAAPSQCDGDFQSVTRWLCSIFQPGRPMKYESGQLRLTRESDLTRLVRYLEQYYWSVLARRSRECRKRKLQMNLSNEAGPVLERPCNYPTTEQQFEGIANWIDDSGAFLSLSHDRDGEDSSLLESTILEFNLSGPGPAGAACSRDELDKVFPIFKTSNNVKYLKYMRDKAGSASISVTEVPKPIVTCYPDGLCSLHYKLQSTAELRLDRIPLRHITDDLDNPICPINISNADDLDNPICPINISNAVDLSNQCFQTAQEDGGPIESEPGNKME